MCKYSIDIVDQKLIVKLHGGNVWTQTEVDQFGDDVSRYIDAGKITGLVIMFGEANLVSSMIGKLLTFKRKLARDGLRLVLTDLNDAALESLKTTGMIGNARGDFFVMAATMEEAMDAITDHA